VSSSSPHKREGCMDTVMDMIPTSRSMGRIRIKVIFDKGPRVRVADSAHVDSQRGG